MVELKITMDDAGRISVNGPIANKMLCYGMLEFAKDAIRAFAEKPSPIVQLPPGATVPRLRE